MQSYETDVRALLRRIKAGPHLPDPLAFYGSSTITMWSTLADDLALPCALNLGFGGSTLEACDYFFERIVVPVQPAALTVYAGDNDLGDGRSPEKVLAFFRSLADKVEKYRPGIPFAFISIKPSPARFGIIDQIKHTNDLIRQEINRRQTGLFIPVFEAMLDESGKPRAELYLDDGLHLGPEGYRLWTRLLSAWRNQIFNLQSAQCNSVRLSSKQCETRVPQVVQPPPQS